MVDGQQNELKGNSGDLLLFHLGVCCLTGHFEILCFMSVCFLSSLLFIFILLYSCLLVFGFLEKEGWS